mmetsp:Transcript_19068/g.41207  ORF Transcript_19068/g.41207 Transcript_19068/m.41207 type:complete len:416 (-) Transcript_19068:268-1515(-)
MPLVTQISQCKTTAVVGSSPLLLGERMGEHIDNHTCVFRVNHAPALGYEQHVGTKTTHRLIGPAMIRVFEGMYNITGSVATCHGCEGLRAEVLQQVRQMCFHEICFYGHKHKKTMEKDSLLLGNLPANRTVLTLSASYTKKVFDWITHAKGMTSSPEKISGGLFTLILAATLTTGRIDAYGFETGKLTCCQPASRSNMSIISDHRLKYKYYEPVQKNMRDKCCATRWRETVDEFEPMHALLGHRVQFHLSNVKKHPVLKRRESLMDGASLPHAAPFRALPELELVLIPFGSQHHDTWDMAWEPKDLRAPRMRLRTFSRKSENATRANATGRARTHANVTHAFGARLRRVAQPQQAAREAQFSLQKQKRNALQEPFSGAEARDSHRHAQRTGHASSTSMQRRVINWLASASRVEKD